MATGENFVSNLQDSLDTMVAAARNVRQYKGRIPSLATKETLKPGTGTAWKEVSFANISASNVADNEELENPQQYSDTALTVTPTLIGVHVVVSNRVAERIDPKAFAKMGTLAQSAIQRKKDQDGLVALDGATNSLSGTGTTLQSGIISAAIAQITGNSTEPAEGPIYAVLHPFQLLDIQNELVAGIGTYAIPQGETAETFRNGFAGKLFGAEVYEDGNITVTSNDAKGGVFAKEGLLLVQGRTPWKTQRDEPSLGGGGTSVWLWDEYAFAERLAGGTTSQWIIEVYSDATTPTS